MGMIHKRYWKKISKDIDMGNVPFGSKAGAGIRIKRASDGSLTPKQTQSVRGYKDQGLLDNFLSLSDNFANNAIKLVGTF